MRLFYWKMVIIRSSERVRAAQLVRIIHLFFVDELKFYCGMFVFVCVCVSACEITISLLGK